MLYSNLILSYNITLSQKKALLNIDDKFIIEDHEDVSWVIEKHLNLYFIKKFQFVVDVFGLFKQSRLVLCQLGAHDLKNYRTKPI